VLATVVARRWGDRVGGIVIAVPVVAGPILLVLGSEQGETFADRAARGALVGIVAVCAYCLVVDRALSHGWARALAAGWLAYALLVVPPAQVQLPPLAGLVVAVVAIASTRALVGRGAEDTRTNVVPPPWDLWARAGVTAALVISLTTVASDLGAAVTGVLTPFPLATSVLVAFTAAQAGRDPTRQALGGYVTGLFGFATFFAVVAIVL
jgi:Protein of unknown function (DUF3147)